MSPTLKIEDDDVRGFYGWQVEDKGRVLMEIDELETLVHIH